jgi:hypothetical protein
MYSNASNVHFAGFQCVVMHCNESETTFRRYSHLEHRGTPEHRATSLADVPKSECAPKEPVTHYDLLLSVFSFPLFAGILFARCPPLSLQCTTAQAPPPFWKPIGRDMIKVLYNPKGDKLVASLFRCHCVINGAWFRCRYDFNDASSSNVVHR